MEALQITPASSDSFERPMIVMTSRGGTSGIPGIPFGHGESSTVPVTRGELSEGSCYTSAIRYAMEFLPRGERLPERVGIALAEEV